MEIICERSRCCGCGLCYSKCPAEAINIEYDDEGFQYPVINPERCISCGLCKSICPVLKDSSITSPSNKQAIPEAFSAYKENVEELLKSSAGGVANSIGRVIIEKGGVVFGVRYNSDFRGVKYDVARNQYTNHRHLIFYLFIEQIEY